MCKELTILAIFLLGLLADYLWFQITKTFDSIFFLQIGLALFLLIFIACRKKISGKAFLFAPEIFTCLDLEVFPLRIST